MAQVTQPLRDEHKELYPHVESLATAADSLGEAPLDAVRREVSEAHAYLTDHLIPHAVAEDKALYPVVGRLMGAGQATATMSRDHVEVGRLTGELGRLKADLDRGELSPIGTKQLRRVLYGLAALVKVHFAKEEEIYLPLLDARLSPQEATAMFEGMEAAAGAARYRHAA